MLTPNDSPPSEGELVARVRTWLDLLAKGQLDRACEELDEPNHYGISWTPDRIASTIQDTFGPGSRFRAEHPEGPIVSPVGSATGDAHPSVVELEDGSGYRVEHDLPLNGAYSDLTVQMEFLWRGDKLAMILHDMHVL